MKKRDVSLPLFDEHHTSAKAEVICADVLKWAETYTGPKFHALLTDAPYHLISGNIGVDWGAFPHAGPHGLKGPTHQSARNGFMNSRWDGTGADGQGIAFKPETWKALAQHLLPGAFIMAFASSRGWHRLACAMEDAGLRIYPSIFGWVNSQSFPKATRVDVQVDKAAGMEQEIIGYRDSRSDYDGCERNSHAMNNGWREAEGRTDISDLSQKPITAPATPLAQIWAGHRYGGQCLKNSLEPIIVAQVPYDKKPVQSIVEHGSGALNIDGARLATGEQAIPNGQSNGWGGVIYGTHAEGYQDYAGNGATHPAGRWPSNFVLQHHPECVAQGTRQVRGTHVHGPAMGGNWGANGIYGAGKSNTPKYTYTDANGMEEVPAYQCHESCVVRKLDLQAGVRRAGGHVNRSDSSHPSDGTIYHPYQSRAIPGVNTYSDTGSASRFFHVSDFALDQQEQAALASGRHSEPPTFTCVPECPVAKLDAQAGERPGPWGHGQSEATAPTPFATNPRAIDNGRWHGDTSNASRFFHVSSWSLDIAECLAQADPAYYCAKSASSEREAGLIGHLPCLSADDPQVVHEGDPVTTRQHYRLDAQGQPIRQKNGAIAYVVCRRNGHPTQKPLTLTQWLATLLLPPAAYGPRRLLNVFSGSGAEGIGALLAGWEEIVMVDSDQGYVDISKHRLAYWSQHKDAQQ